jgi:predicted phosphodiesterase
MKNVTDYRAVVLADIHLDPFDTEVHPAFKVAREYTFDIRPEILVLNGDIGEFESLSSWNRKKPLIAEGRRYQDDVEVVKLELYNFRHKLPHARIIYVMGNHEQRAMWYCEKNAELAGFIDLPRDLHLEQLGIEFVEFNKDVRIGELSYAHGWFWNKYHANKTLHEFGGNILYGHVHQFQQETRNVHFGRKQQIAQSLGCLGERHPDWKSNRPTRFQNGFATVEYRNDGTFNINPHLIYEGEFSYGGWTWKA